MSFALQRSLMLHPWSYTSIGQMKCCYCMKDTHLYIYNMQEKNTKLSRIQHLSNILEKDRYEWKAAWTQV